jgi:hypothetical protein
MGNTTELRRELKDRFVPIAVSHSYSLSEQRAPFFLEFRRVRHREEQYFDIQWDKYGRPRFVVNFASAAGRGRLQPGKGSTVSSWFRQDLSFLRRLIQRRANRSASAVIDELIQLFDELERFFSDRSVGPHVRVWPDGV